MAVRTVVRRSQRISIEEETTEGTPVAETANGAMVVSGEGATFNLERDWLSANMMSGSFSKEPGEAGMYSDDMGATLPTKLRGIGTLGANGPDWQMLAKSAFGSEVRATSGTIDTGATAITIPVKTGGPPTVGQLLYFPTQSEVRQITAWSSPNMTLDVPLSAIPSEDDEFKCGVNWMCTSDPDHPFFTLYAYFGASQDMRLRFTSCKVNQMKLTATVGGYCNMEFVVNALKPATDNTSQAISPTYDATTPELVCLGMSGWQRVSGTITGVPTTTETVLLAPNFDVRVGDQIQVDVGSSVWETKAITAVSGDAGSNLTITHAALSGAGTATETAYILRSICADVGEEFSLTMDCPVGSKKCMGETYGKSGLVSMDRNITIESSPYFESWEQFLMRDNAVGVAHLLIFGDISGDDQNNIVALWLSKAVNSSVSINNDDIMTQSVTSQVAKDATLGDEYEIVLAAF
jgi:hypothetical protein